MTSVGSKIRELRIKKGFTQEQLGELIGVKKAAIQKYESGRVKNLKQATITKFSEIFDVPPWTFVESQYDMNDLCEEVKALDLLGKHFGAESIEMLHLFVQLNSRGKEKVMELSKDLLKITDYRED